MDRSDYERALGFPCTDCGAKAGEDCQEPAAPEGPGWHESRLRRHEPAIVYTVERVKPLAELRPSDVPPGMDSDDLATDLAPDQKAE